MRDNRGFMHEFWKGTRQKASFEEDTEMPEGHGEEGFSELVSLMEFLQLFFNYLCLNDVLS